LDFKIGGTNVDYIKKLDEHEYDENKMKYNYPDEIKNKIMIAEKEIIDMFNNKKMKDLVNNDLLY
jgi:protein associated with RNAse G/E